MEKQGEVSFSRLDQAKAEDFQVVHAFMAEQHDGLADRVLGHLKSLEGPKLGFKVDRLEHSLQTATRAYRDGAEEEQIICALLHDIGDQLAPDNHGAFASEVLRPFISQENYNIVRYHPEFQGYFFFDKIGSDPNIRDRHRGESWFDAAHYFCEAWDMPAFDPDYKSEPLDFFVPIVRKLFSSKPAHNGINIKTKD